GDGTELGLAPFEPGGLGQSRLVAGGPDEAVSQPEWSPDGVLHLVSDRSGWWNLYRAGDGCVLPRVEMEAELGVPAWWFGLSTYTFLPGGRIGCLSRRGPEEGLHVVAPGSTGGSPLALPFTTFTRRGRSQLRA